MNTFLIDIFECCLSFIDSLTRTLPVSRTHLKKTPTLPQHDLTLYFVPKALGKQATVEMYNFSVEVTSMFEFVIMNKRQIKTSA